MELFSYMLNAFAVLYWIFRAYIVASGGTSGIVSPNQEIEIFVILITLISIVMVIKRKLFFAAIYLATYFAFFGVYILKMLEGSMDSKNFVVYMLGIAIALFNFLDVLLNKNRKVGQNKKGEWFYGNDKYEREYDDRADTNQYKIR
ncbi:MAG: hypothetical protein ACTTGJ_01140 [Clostridium sp.]